MVPDELRDMLRDRLARVWAGSSLVRRIGLLISFVAVLMFLLGSSLVPERLSLKVGDLAPKDIPAPREFVDWPATSKLRQEAAARVDDKYELNRSVDRQVQEEVAAIFAELQALRDRPLGTGANGMPKEDKIEEARRITGIDVSSEVFWDVLSSDEATFLQIREDTLAVLAATMEGGIKEDALNTFKRELSDRVTELGYPKSAEVFIRQLAGNNLRANLFLNEQETLRQRQIAMDSVEPVKILKNQIIVRKGDPLTEDDIIRLRDAGLLSNGLDLSGYVGSLLLALLLVGLALAYLYFFKRDIYDEDSRLFLFGLISLLTLVISRVIWPISGFLSPVAAGGMLFAILLDERLAVVGSVLLSVGVGFLAGSDLRVVFVALVGGLVGVYSVTRVSQRSDLMRAGFIVGVANVVSILALTLVSMESLLQAEIWWDSLWGVVNGLFSAVLTIGTLPFFESLFGIITSIKLLELSNPNHPLLRRLLMEAPGTYHHSIMVGNLAEAAAEAVGADPLLSRVGAYYHDIGKLKRPYFFIENQLGGQNPHDRISPNLSALIITSHVRDGVELAREYNLPKEITDFIDQHHGTTLVSYFFNRATENGRAEQVLEENFRHDGPIPQSKSVAVVMLADAVEAAVRSMGRPTPGRIEGTVRKLIKDRLEQGQLDQSDLTLKDLDTMASTFSRVLSGVFHTRVEYPEQLLREMEKEGKRGWVLSGEAGDSRENRKDRDEVTDERDYRESSEGYPAS